MKKFMVLFLAPVSAEQQMNVPADEMKKAMQPWFAWFEKVGTALVDKGMPLGKGVNMTKNGSSERKTQIAGYSIIQAADLDAAKAMIADHPHFMLPVPGASIEVLEMMPMPGM